MAMRIAVIILTLMIFSSSAFAECTTNAFSRTVCSNGEQAGGYNANTGNAWKSEKAANGVATTQTSAGGKAKTKNGKGYMSARMAKNVTRQQITKVVIEV